MSLFGEAVRREALKILVPKVDHVLSAAGFKQTDLGEWERDSKWKIEEVDLRLSKVTRLGLQPALRVAIPRSDASLIEEKYHYLAEIKLPRILDSTAPVDACIALPKLGYQVQKFVDHFTLNIKAALSWFEQFATPEGCQASLGKFLKPGCPVDLNAEQFLNRLGHH